MIFNPGLEIVRVYCEQTWIQCDVILVCQCAHSMKKVIQLSINHLKAHLKLTSDYYLKPSLRSYRALGNTRIPN